uniref:Uncharacterized protein n=1 Tax=Tetradesmus obliquus TaxID=3088 RepID=A0A383VZ40_TETOB
MQATGTADPILEEKLQKRAKHLATCLKTFVKEYQQPVGAVSQGAAAGKAGKAGAGKGKAVQGKPANQAPAGKGTSWEGT